MQTTDLYSQLKGNDLFICKLLSQLLMIYLFAFLQQQNSIVREDGKVNLNRIKDGRVNAF